MAGQDIHKINSGGVPDLEDGRDFPFEAFVGAEGDFPTTYDWRDQYPIKKKGQWRSWACTGFTTSSYAEVLNFAETGEYLELSPRWIYAFVSLGMYQGAYTRHAVMRLVNAGDAPEAIFGSEPMTEEHMTDTSGSTPAIEAEALIYKARLATSITDKDNFELLKLAIYQNKGITLGIGNHVMYAPAYNEDEIICQDSLYGNDRVITRANVEAGKLHSLWTIIDEVNEEENDMTVNEGNANGILYAITKKVDNPEKKALADALNNGDQKTATNIIENAILSKIQEL